MTTWELVKAGLIAAGVLAIAPILVSIALVILLPVWFFFFDLVDHVWWKFQNPWYRRRMK